ncbi:MAG: hypothetical protein AAF587_09275 [Bacteroidota bacterium]
MNVRILSTYFLCFFLLGRLTVAPCQSSSSFVKQSDIPIVDGDLSDWEDIFVKHKKENWFYGLIYDEQAIYVGMAILDPDIQYQLLMTGLTCWLEIGKDKKNKKGVRFPTGSPENQRPTDSESLIWYIEELAKNKQTVIGELAGLELINVRSQKQTLWGDNVRDDGLAVQVGMNAEGDLLYELRLPRTLFPELWHSETEKATKFSLYWETGSLGRPKDIAGKDVIGITGGTTSNPAIYGGESVRSIHAKQDQYRAYASPRQLKLKNLILP